MSRSWALHFEKYCPGDCSLELGCEGCDSSVFHFTTDIYFLRYSHPRGVRNRWYPHFYSTRKYFLTSIAFLCVWYCKKFLLAISIFVAVSLTVPPAFCCLQISFDLAEYTADVDGVGTLRLLDAIKTCGLINSVKFYQASTSELYGKVQEIPQKETTPFYPRSPYGKNNYTPPAHAPCSIWVSACVFLL